jgi:hypothetical protein
MASTGITRKEGRLPAREAKKFAAKIHASDAVEKAARAAKDQTALEKAVIAKLEGQRDFAAVYKAEHPGGGPGRGKRLVSTDKSFRDWCQSFGFAYETVARWLPLLDPAGFEAKRAMVLDRCWKLAELWQHVRGTEGTGEFERYTPWEYIEAVCKVLGEIDLDPASCVEAQSVVRAKRYFTVKDDGLQLEWHGRVFLNPPYHKQLLPAFVSKLVAEVGSGRVTSAILLTNNCTDTGWFAEAHSVCDALCFTRGRIGFTVPGGSVVAPTQGQCFFYFGTDVEKFADVFLTIGIGMQRLWKHGG